MRYLLVFFISGLTGLVLSGSRCKSIPIQEKEAKQIAELDAVENDIAVSNLSPVKKAAAVKTLDGAKTMIREQGQTITEQAAQIDNLKKYRKWVWIGGAALAGLAGLFVWKRFF